MALVQCKECKQEISNKAKKCPQCGAPIRRTSLFTWLVLILVILLGASYLSAPRLPDSSATNVGNPSPTPQWAYSSSKDEMTGKGVYVAVTQSINMVNFSFPYQGDQKATLTFRTHPQHGKDILFDIEKGQFLCGISEGCSLLVRFDESQPIKFRATEPSDHSTTTLFIRDYSGFMTKMLKSKKVLIQAEFFHEGNKTLEFDVAKFDVKKYKPY